MTFVAEAARASEPGKVGILANSATAMLSEIPDDEFAAALDACAAELLWEAGVVRPPVDALAVAEGLRLVVTRDFAMPHRGRFVRLADREENGGGIGTIVVGVAERPEREHWAKVAHEIGESIAYRVFDRLGVAFDEALAADRTRIGGEPVSKCAVVKPRRWFAVDGRECEVGLAGVEKRFCTASHELIARRMLGLCGRRL